jgi:outer membrane protein OmpA-like peptidoglycan-associated protein
MHLSSIRGRSPSLAIVGIIAMGALSLGGCATKKFVAESLAPVSSQLATQGAHLDAVDKTSREALERATAAGKLAEGKFLYTVVLSDDAVKFPTDVSALSPEAESRLAELAERLRSENKNVYVEIQGHTDDQGSDAYNMRLGSDRAEAVRRYLSHAGIALNRMATISYGEGNPVAPNTTPEGRAQNRRVVLVVLS